MEPKQKTSRFRMMIEDLLPNLGSQEGKIARWMLSNEKEVVNTPIKDIAAICSVSQPTVVRFCKKLGCTGTKDLKVLLNSIKGGDEDSTPCTFDNTEKEIFHKVFSTSLLSIEKTFAETSWDEISNLSEKILSSSTIYTLGMGGSAIVAKNLFNEIKRLGLNAFYLDSIAMGSNQYNFKSGDLLIFVSRSGENKTLIEIAKRALSCSSYIFTITTDDNSRLFGLSDDAIKVSENQYLENDTNSYSRLGELAIVEAVYLMCAKKMGDTVSDFKENYYRITKYKD